MANPFRDLRLSLDPCAMFREVVGEPDSWQEQLLTSESRRQLLCCSRQVGKSSIAGALGLHIAKYKPGSLVLLVSPSLRQSGELLRKCTTYNHLLDGHDTPVELESVTRLELTNGSRIISLPGSESTVRGYSAADCVIVDEASRVSDELYAAIRPSLATTNGRLIMLSTPFGKRGQFWEAWEHGGDLYERIKIVASQCPRISPEFLEEEKKALGEWLYRQEYGCEFLDQVTQLFSSDLIAAAFSNEVQALWQ